MSVIFVIISLCLSLAVPALLVWNLVKIQQMRKELNEFRQGQPVDDPKNT